MNKEYKEGIPKVSGYYWFKPSRNGSGVIVKVHTNYLDRLNRGPDVWSMGNPDPIKLYNCSELLFKGPITDE